MTLRDKLIKRATAYCDQTDLKLKTLSYRLANDSKFFDRLIAGKDLTTGRYEDINSKLDALEQTLKAEPA